MKKISVLLAFLIVVGICIPAVSAEKVIWDDTAYEFIDTSGHAEITQLGSETIMHFKEIYMHDISLYETLAYVVFTIDSTSYGAAGYSDNGELLPAGRHEFTYALKDQPKKLLIVYIDRYPTSTKITMFFEEWDIEELSGPQRVNIYGMNIMTGSGQLKKIGGSDLTEYPIMIANHQSDVWCYIPGSPVRADWTSGNEWQNHIYLKELDPNPLGGYEFSLTRIIDGKYHQSECKVYKDDEIIFSNSSTTDIKDRWFSLGSITQINVTSPTGRVYKFPVTGGADPDDPDDPVTADVTVYIKNSQTGALIADANVAIDALVNGEYYPVVNRTEPSGIFSITLQPTGGGQPNPDGYRLIVTADGYNNPMPEINFTVDDYKNYIYCLLDPIAGGPVNENKTFIDFFVRDMSSNPISGATVKFGKYTLITNSQGYTVFEVDKNNNYSWTISKSGYGPLTGNAVIGDAPRHTINTVLAPIVTPTTPIPTSPPIGPTPTMTAPTGEPVSNWLEWFAAHFGMILGGGVEIGKIFMWLCFTVPVGVYVGKEAKAGAAGFMAGAGIVTLFFVLIGWVPIWLVVLLALIIGLLYAKAFNSQDNGGGR